MCYCRILYVICPKCGTEFTESRGDVIDDNYFSVVCPRCHCKGKFSMYPPKPWLWGDGNDVTFRRDSNDEEPIFPAVDSRTAKAVRIENDNGLIDDFDEV